MIESNTVLTITSACFLVSSETRRDFFDEFSFCHGAP